MVGFDSNLKYIRNYFIIVSSFYSSFTMRLSKICVVYQKSKQLPPDFCECFVAKISTKKKH